MKKRTPRPGDRAGTGRDRRPAPAAGTSPTTSTTTVQEAAAGHTPAAAVGEAALPSSRRSRRGSYVMPRFGEAGPPLDKHNPLRVGFLAGIGLALAYGVFVGLNQLASVLTLIAVAIFLALGLEPIIEFLVRRGLRRGLAITLVFLGIIGIFAAFASRVVPLIVEQTGQLVESAPGYLTSIQQQDWFKQLDERFSIVSQVTKQVQGWVSDGGVQQVLGGVVGVGTALVSGLFNAFTVLILTLFFAAGLNPLRSALFRLAPASRRQRVTLLGNEISRRIGGYVIGQIAVASLNGICSYVVMTILDMPYAVMLAVAVGLLGLIPMVGATLGAVVVAAVAAFQSLNTALIVVIYYVIYQQFENYVISPQIMKRTVDVPALVTMIAALVGGSLMGVVGALMAVPVAAAIMLIIQEVVYPAQDRS